MENDTRDLRNPQVVYAQLMSLRATRPMAKFHELADLLDIQKLHPVVVSSLKEYEGIFGERIESILEAPYNSNNGSVDLNGDLQDDVPF